MSTKGRIEGPVEAKSSPGDTGNASPQWYAVYTYSRHEKSVRDHLDAKAVEVFLPTVAVENRWKDRNVQLDLPAFPGYVFVRIALSERSKVLSVPGVVRILSFNGAPAPVHHDEIDSIRLCLERNSPLRPHPFLEIGERVRVRSGALQGLEGLVARKKGSCRLVLSIALIHQSVAVEVDADQLETMRPGSGGVSHASDHIPPGNQSRLETALCPAKK